MVGRVARDGGSLAQCKGLVTLVRNELVELPQHLVDQDRAGYLSGEASEDLCPGQPLLAKLFGSHFDATKCDVFNIPVTAIVTPVMVAINLPKPKVVPAF